MRIGSLFSGVGGLDMAVEAAFNGHVVWFAEVNKDAAAVLAHRFPGIPNLGDLTEVDWSDVEPVDVLAGGFPCQDVSSAGRRAGIAPGTRSGLWSVFANAIEVMRPSFVVIENVRGILSAKANRTRPDGDGQADGSLEPVGSVVGGSAPSEEGTAETPVLRAMGAVLGDLSDLGYDAWWRTVSAASVGAPHKRERVFILAVPAANPPGAGD